MKVFFIASTYLDNFEMARSIYGEIRKLGYTMVDDFVLSVDVKKHRNASDEYWASMYQNMMSGIIKSDVCVFEISAPSTGLGQLIQESIRREKPVILLRQNDKFHILLDGIALTEKRVQSYEYDNRNIEEVLEYSLENARELMTIRFTMLMPAELDNFLTEINRTQGISRSDYIRNLLLKEKKNLQK
jgi:hypothetical protein